MATLEELRLQLDEIDNQLVKLYENRMQVCKEVGELKVNTGRKVFDKQREKEKLTDVSAKVSGDFNKKGIQELYEQLMSMSRKLQYQQLVEAMPGSYSRESKVLMARPPCSITLEKTAMLFMSEHSGMPWRQSKKAPRTMPYCPSKILLPERSMRCTTFW